MIVEPVFALGLHFHEVLVARAWRSDYNHFIAGRGDIIRACIENITPIGDETVVIKTPLSTIKTPSETQQLEPQPKYFKFY